MTEHTSLQLPATAYSDERVSAQLGDAARMPGFRLTMAWWGVASAMFYVFLGANLALTFGAVNSVIGMLLAALLFGLIGGALARYAVRTGSSSSALSLTMLGRLGGSLPTLILAITGVYYAVFEGSVLALAASKVIAGLSYPAAATVVVLYSAPLAAGGVQRFLDKLNGLLLPFYVGGLLLLIGMAIAHSPKLEFPSPHYIAGKSWLELISGIGVWRCFVAYLGLLVITMVSMDFARFGRASDERFHARIAFGLPFYLLTFVLSGIGGVVLIAATAPSQVSETSVVDTSLSVLGAMGGLAWVFVTQTRINSANYYVATLNFQAALEELLGVRVPKLLCAVLTGMLVLALMRATDVFSYMLAALAYQGIFVTAWVGLAVAHVSRKAEVKERGNIRAKEPDGEQRRLLLPGVAAWLGGVTVGTGLMLAGGNTATLSAPATLSVAALLYWLIAGIGDGRHRVS